VRIKVRNKTKYKLKWSERWKDWDFRCPPYYTQLLLENCNARIKYKSRGCSEDCPHRKIILSEIPPPLIKRCKNPTTSEQCAVGTAKNSGQKELVKRGGEPQAYLKSRNASTGKKTPKSTARSKKGK
jgi:hypothetical protein